jgi:RNA polymerase sigma factor (sigma-70 family)
MSTTHLPEAERLAEIAALVEEQKADDNNRIEQDRYRRGAGVHRMVSLESAIAGGFDAPSTIDAIHEEIDDVADRDRLAKAVDALPEAQRDVVNALFYERVSEAVLAERLGVSRALVRKRRDQALANLRSQYGIDLPVSA